MGLNRTQPINKAHRALITGLKSVLAKTINISFLSYTGFLKQRIGHNKRSLSLSLSLSLFFRLKIQKSPEDFSTEPTRLRLNGPKVSLWFYSSFDLSFVCLFFWYWFYILFAKEALLVLAILKRYRFAIPDVSLFFFLSLIFIFGLNLLNPIFCYTISFFSFFSFFWF